MALLTTKTEKPDDILAVFPQEIFEQEKEETDSITNIALRAKAIHTGKKGKEQPYINAILGTNNQLGFFQRLDARNLPPEERGTPRGYWRIVMRCGMLN